MSAHFSDAELKDEKVQIELLRTMPDWRKFRLTSELTEVARALALAGLREWFPHASEGELRRRFATVWLGHKLATQAYGPEPDPPTFDVLPVGYLEEIRTCVDTVVFRKKLQEYSEELSRQ